MSAAENSEFEQNMRASDGLYGIEGRVYRAAPGVLRLEQVGLIGYDNDARLVTTVSIRPGQTLVLGSAPKEGSTATLLLTVRAEEGPGPAQ